MKAEDVVKCFANDFASTQRGIMLQFDKLPLPCGVIKIEVNDNNEPIDFIFVYANSEFAKLENVNSKNDLLGMSFYEIFPDGDKEWLEIYAKTAIKGKVQTIERYSKEIDKYLSIKCYQPMQGYCCCLVLDITDKKETEYRLFEEKERYRAAMKTSTDILFEYDINRDFFTAQGVLRQDIGGFQKINEQIRDFMLVVQKEKIVLEEDFEKFKELITIGSKITTEIKIKVHSDRSCSYRWYLMNASTVCEDGKVVRVIGALRDIENWKKIQEEKMEVETLNHEINHVLGDIYYAVVHIDLENENYNFVKLTNQTMIEYPEKGNYKDFLNRIDYIMEPEYSRDFKRRFAIDELRRNLKKNGDKIEMDLLRKVKGENKWCNVMVSFLPDFRGQKRQQAILVARFTDEERRREIEQRMVLKDALEAAHSANEAKTEFLSKVSHDIRTPMNAIIGMTDIAKQNLDNPMKIKDCLSKISISSKHLLDLINDVLNMSKIESGKMILSENEIMLPELAEEVLEIIRPMALKREHILELDIKTLEHPFVIGDATHIKQILINIISNAVKYTPVGGKINFNIHEHIIENSERINYVFEIKDTGIGLTNNFIPKIFDMFERGIDSRINKIEGTGLGLAICKNLTNLMGGTIEARNGEHGGAIFTISLPLKILNKKTRTMIEKEEITARNFQDTRVLLVEDNELNAEIAGEFLNILGIEFDQATNGQDALNMFIHSKQNYYRLILMDVRMPIMNGYDATRNIRGLERDDAKIIPIIAMTADTFSSDVRMAHTAGMNEHLGKPINMKLLEDVLQRWLV